MNSIKEIKEIKEGLKNLLERLEKLEKANCTPCSPFKKPFKLTYPEDDHWVFCVDSDTGEIIEVYYTANNTTDRFLFEHGYYFKTRGEAEQYLKKRKLMFKLQQWAKIKNGDWEPDWSDRDSNKYLIYYDGEAEVLRTNAGTVSNTISTLPFFKTREIVQECIDLFGEEIKEVLC